ncbi:MAG: type 4a pilus biogenesis protein PilO [Candidatus Solibacter usitatus]|nr:type 4a pilus biogenesis protein PilO [Candidatus Solibacter usitatus]
MARSFNLRKLDWRDRRTLMRAAMVLLLAANVVAALVLFKPWGGSASDLARQLDEKRQDLVQQNLRLERTKVVAAKVEKARSEGDRFLADYTLLRRTAFSTLVSEINAMAIKAGMKPKESSYVLEPVEGSEALEQLTLSVNYEGSYTSLTQFVRSLDRSNRFLIIQSLQAAPQPSGVLSVNLKVDIFVRQPAGGIS